MYINAVQPEVACARVTSIENCPFSTNIRNNDVGECIMKVIYMLLEAIGAE